MNIKRVLLMGMLFFLSWQVSFALAFAANHEQQYLQELDSKDINDRVSALSKINQELKSGELVLNENIKQKCYQLIKEVTTPGFKDDGEGLFEWEVTTLAIKINNKKVLPFLLSRISSDFVQEAIAENSAETLDELFKMLDNLDNLNYWKRRDLFDTFTKIVNKSKDNLAVQDNVRQRVKGKMIENLKQAQYPDKRLATQDKKRFILEMHTVATSVKEPIIDFLIALGDKDIIPLLEDLKNNDEGYEDISEDYLPYYKMSHEERMQHSREIAEITKKARSNEPKFKSGEYKEKTTRYYPVREKAAKALEELKSKNGL